MLETNLKSFYDINRYRADVHHTLHTFLLKKYSGDTMFIRPSVELISSSTISSGLWSSLAYQFCSVKASPRMAREILYSRVQVLQLYKNFFCKRYLSLNVKCIVQSMYGLNLPNCVLFYWDKQISLKQLLVPIDPGKFRQVFASL